MRAQAFGALGLAELGVPAVPAYTSLASRHGREEEHGAQQQQARNHASARARDAIDALYGKTQIFRLKDDELTWVIYC